MKEIKKNVVLFAGTTKGRLLAGYLQELNQSFVTCVTTRYTRDLLEDMCKPDQAGCMEIRQGRLNVTKIERMFDELRPGLVINTTHPYAVGVTRNIRVACSGRKRLRLIRCLRELRIGDNRPGAGVVHMPGAGVVHMPDVEATATWPSPVTGNISVTTGSKELSSYTRIRDYERRIYARVLPSEEAVARCRSLRLRGRRIITMQESFPEEMSLVQLREHGYTYLVTKDGGAAGGFLEKVKAARRAGAAAVVIDQPGSGEGISLDEIRGRLKEWMDHEKKRGIYG